MLELLRFSDFKSWLDTGDIPLKRMTGIFGANSSGKTSILQFLLLLKQTAASPDRALVLSFGSDDKSLVNLGSFQNVLHVDTGGTASSITCELSWSTPHKLTILDPETRNAKLFEANQLTFTMIVDQTARGPRVERMSYDFIHEGKRLRFGLSRESEGDGNYDLLAKGYSPKKIRGRSWALPAPIKYFAFPDQVNSYYQNVGFLNQFAAAFQNQLDSLYYLGPLRDYPKREYTWGGEVLSDMGRRGENVVAGLLASQRMPAISRGYRKKKKTVDVVVAEWLKQLGLVHSFRVEGISPGSNLFRVLVKQTRSSSEVLISEVGFGVSQVLPVITLCYYVPEGSTVIFEQPEIHLHPLVQAGLADVFIDAIKTRNIQIIVESHSEHLLTRLQLRLAQDALKPDDTALYFCEREKLQSKLTPLEFDDFGNITNWPKNFFGDDFNERAEMMRAIAKRMGSGK